MILDRGCFERGCACYDERVDKDGIEVVKKEWVGLTDEEIEAFKQSCHLGGVGYDTFIKRFAIGIEAKLKEKNT